MVEVFITDIQNAIQAERVIATIQQENFLLKIDFDLNETELSFPCGHTILRIEGHSINSDKIIAIVKNQGYNCEVLEDKICRQ
jgi:hypothetical protein